MSEEDDYLKYVATVHDVVSTTNTYVETIDKVLTQETKEYYVVPREILRGFREIMLTNTILVKKLFDENELLVKHVEDLIAKYGIEKNHG